MFVLMVVPSDFPEGDAGAVRDDAFARIYRDLGYDVMVICNGRKIRTGVYNNTEFVSIYEDIHGLLGKIKRFLINPLRIKRIIKTVITERGIPSIIHINHIPESVIHFLIDIAKKNDVPIVHDSVEWYSACEFRMGIFDKAYILKDRLNRKVIKNPIRVYAISTYLQQHFIDQGVATIRIPVIMDVLDTKIIQCDLTNDRVKIIYAGNPGNKDYIKEIVLGVCLLAEEEQEKLILSVYGLDEQQIKTLTFLEKLPQCINIYGKVERADVKRALQNSDFSVLLRPSNERYAMAGFPTKSVEAMSHGVAMLCNLSSDLRIYLKDNENAIVVAECGSEELASAIRRILKMSRSEIELMKKRARITAELNYDYRLYLNEVRKFIGDD